MSTHTRSIALFCALLTGAGAGVYALASSGSDPGTAGALDDDAATAALAPAAPPQDAAVATPDATLGHKIGSFEVTYYWVAAQRKATGDVALLDRKSCEPIAMVTPDFAERITREGTGRLLDGRTVNVAGTCGCDATQCYFVVGKNKAWGVGVAERPLAPFRSVAVDSSVVPIGTMLYVEELDGLTMPGREPWGGFIHDGCLVADDRGGGVEGRQLDLFMGKRVYYQGLKNRHQLKRVTVYDGTGRCERDRAQHVRAINRNSI